MVYRGRPSTGCKKCRERKIKCDEKPSGCVKCADKGYTCPGYDRTLDRLFHDESARVQEKAQRAKAKAIIAREERELKARSKNAIVKVQDAIGAPLLCPLIDQGIAFFMSNYALGLEQPPFQSDAYHSHLSTHGFHPIIATSMTALGLAGVANICMDANLKREASRWYVNAIQMTNSALASPREATTDSTLLATMLLSVFEATDNERTLSGWSNHVAGSASLLRMRGTGQFSTPAGRRMYMQTVGLLTMNCMGMGEPLPDYVHEMNKEIVKHEDSNDPGNRFYHLHIDAIDFRAQILKQQFPSFQAILDRALEIDTGAKGIFDNVGDEWRYEEIQCGENTPGVFGDSYHVYPHLAAAQTWNWVRYNRIYMNDIIRNTLIAGFSMTPPAFRGTEYLKLLEDSTQKLYKMQADILASIPQYLHDTPKVPTNYNAYDKVTYAPTSTKSLESIIKASLASPISLISTPDSSPSPTPLPADTTENLNPRARFLWSNFRNHDIPGRGLFATPATPKDRLPIVRVSGGYSSLWALYIAGSMPVATPEAQEFVLKSLYRVSAEFGINQAKVLASALKTKQQLDSLGLGNGTFDIAPDYLPKVGDHLEGF